STEGSGSVQGMWQSAYSSINTANTAIAALTASTALPTTLKNTRLAENRFLRAMYYFELVRTYGAVQLNLEPTQGVSIQAHRTPVNYIYPAAIIPDPQLAIDNPPARGAQPDYSRPTRAPARAPRAGAYLTRAASGAFEKAIQLPWDVTTPGKYTLNPNFPALF